MVISKYQKYIFDKIFDLTGRCKSIWIAGGAVIDVHDASDIDVWFGNSENDKAEAFLNALPIKNQFQALHHYPIKAGHIVGNGYMDGFLIQVLVVSHATPEAHLDDFDISTHMWAYTAKGVLVKGQYATEPQDPPKVITANYKTFERYVKICKRYAFPIDEAVLKNIGVVQSEDAV